MTVQGNCSHFCGSVPVREEHSFEASMTCIDTSGLGAWDFCLMHVWDGGEEVNE